MNTVVKAASMAAVATFAVAGLAACSGSQNNSSSASPTTTSSPTNTGSPTHSPSHTGSSPYVGATCTKESLSSVIPSSATITTFHCGSTGDGEIAGIVYGPGTNVQFAKTTGIGGPWQPVNKDTICGTASAGLPDAILALCKK